MTNMNSFAGYSACSCFIKCHVESALASAISMSHTRIGKDEPKVVLTARWHMSRRCM